MRADRRRFLRAIGAGATIAAARGAFAVEPETSKKPNIILVMADDQGWGDMGYNGHPVLKTPHFDKMAAETADEIGTIERIHVQPGSLLLLRYDEGQPLTDPAVSAFADICAGCDCKGLLLPKNYDLTALEPEQAQALRQSLQAQVFPEVKP